MVQPISDVLDLKPLTRIYEQGQLSHNVEIARVTQPSPPRNSRILHTDRLTILGTLMNRYPAPSALHILRLLAKIVLEVQAQGIS